ncbi:MAG: SH3 domain-containing protein [Pyrinomonadaceae bacterium]
MKRYSVTLILCLLAANVGYGQSLSPCHAELAIFDTDQHGLNLRTGPGTNYPISTNITDLDSVLYIEGIHGKWVRVIGTTRSDNTSPDLNGWVYGPLLGTLAFDRDSGNETKLYSQPSEESKIVAKFSHGEKLSFEGCSNHWVKVRSGDKAGWTASGR